MKKYLLSSLAALALVPSFALAAIGVVLQSESRDISTTALANLPPGFGVGAPPFSINNPANWREQDYIPLNLHITGGPALTPQQIDIQIDHNDVSGTQGIAGLVNYTPPVTPGSATPTNPAGNIFTVASGTAVVITNPNPIPTIKSTGVWTYTLFVTFTSTSADIQCAALLSPGAHGFGGASLQIKGSGGTMSIVKPGVAPGSPDLTITKTGDSSAAIGSTVHYTLTYSNLSNSSSSPGTAIQDNLPAGLAYQGFTCSTTTNGCPSLVPTVIPQPDLSTQIIWNVGTLAPLAGGAISFTGTVNTDPALVNTTVTNSVQAITAATDTNLSNNTSSKQTLIVAVATSVTTTAVSGTYSGQVNLTATLTAGAVGLSGKTITFTLDGNVVCGSGPSQQSCPTTNGSGVATLNNVYLSSDGTSGGTFINAGTYSNGAVASFAGDATYGGSSDSQTLTINKATPTATLAVTNSPQIYSGSGQTATVGVTTSSVAGSVANIVTGGAATQTNAGTYAVTADFVPNDTTNYNTLSAVAAGNFVINKATPTATLAVTNSPQTYTGLAQAATVGITSSSVSGSVANISTGGAATQTNAGTYAATADFVPDDTANYETLLGLSAGNFVIGKATPTATLAVTNSPQTYTGVAQAATVGITSSSVSGSVTNISTGGAATQTSAGTYAVTADFVPTDTANFNSLTALSAGNFVVDKATPTATLGVTNSPVTYTGSAQAAAVGVTTSSVPGSVAKIVTGGAATQTNAGTYAVTADFVPNDTANFNSLITLPAGNFVIDKATPTATLAVTNSPQTYTALGQAATVGITTSSVPGFVANIVTGGAATQTNAGTYAVTADFVPNDTANFNNLTALSAGNFVISKATPTATLSVTNSPQTYSGSGEAALVGVTTSSVPGSAANTLTGGAASQTNAGTYAVTADFVPTDTANYNSVVGLSAGNFVINKATPTASLAVTNSPQVYTGNPQAALVGITTSSVPGAVANVLTGGAASQINAATYPATADFVPTDTANYNSLLALPAGNFVISKADLPLGPSGININPYTKLYDTQEHHADGTATGLKGENLSSLLNFDLTKHTAVGTYSTDKWTFNAAGANTNYNGAEGVITDSITNKVLHVTAAGVSRTYDATIAATVTLSTDALTGDQVTASYTSATFDNKNIGTAKPVTATGISISGAQAGNYTLANTTANTTADITKRAITVTAQPDTKLYDGTTTSTVLPKVTSGTIATGDTGNFTQSFSSSAAGKPLTLTPSGTVADTNNGDNYAYTFVPITVPGSSITVRTVTPAVTAASKTYDGTTSATIAARNLTGVLGGDTVTLNGGTATFSDPNAGSGKTVTAVNLTLTGADAGNYALSTTTVTTTADIFKASQTINFPAIPNKILHVDGPFAVNPTASSGLPVTLALTSGPATVDTSTNTVTVTGTGKITLTATQAGNNNYDAATAAEQFFSVVPPPALLNISTRGRVGTKDNVLIGGYIIKGVEAKKFGARGIGPSLKDAGVTDVVGDPQLELHGSDGKVIMKDDDWQDDATQAADLTAVGLAPKVATESALTNTSMPGAYTAIVSDKAEANGTGLVELYDLSQNADATLANLSTRGVVGSGEDVLIGGFIVNGNVGAAKVILRAIGPSLSQAGITNALANPTLQLHDNNGVLIGSNDNWQDDANQAAAIQAAGIPPQSALESALMTTLSPGNYTVVVADKNGTSGVALVEIFDVTYPAAADTGQ